MNSVQCFPFVSFFDMISKYLEIISIENVKDIKNHYYQASIIPVKKELEKKERLN